VSYWYCRACRRFHDGDDGVLETPHQDFFGSPCHDPVVELIERPVVRGESYGGLISIWLPGEIRYSCGYHGDDLVELLRALGVDVREEGK